MSDSTKSLPEPMLICHQLDPTEETAVLLELKFEHFSVSKGILKVIYMILAGYEFNPLRSDDMYASVNRVIVGPGNGM